MLHLWKKHVQSPIYKTFSLKNIFLTQTRILNKGFNYILLRFSLKQRLMLFREYSILLTVNPIPKFKIHFKPGIDSSWWLKQLTKTYIKCMNYIELNSDYLELEMRVQTGLITDNAGITCNIYFIANYIRNHNTHCSQNTSSMEIKQWPFTCIQFNFIGSLFKIKVSNSQRFFVQISLGVMSSFATLGNIWTTVQWVNRTNMK